MAKPVAGEWIEDNFRAIAFCGVTHMVSLLEPQEIRELGLTKAPDLCAANGMGFVNFPIRDRGLPPSVAAACALVNEIFLGIEAGSHTVIHCRAGIGRTGLIAAAVMVRAGYAAEEAFATVSLNRGVKVPDTPEQYEWVVAQQRALRGS